MIMKLSVQYGWTSSQFRELLIEKLRNAIKSNHLLVVSLDNYGARRYTDKFIDEVFGDLCRLEVFRPLEILGYLQVTSEESPDLVKRVHQSIGDALGWPNFIDLYIPNARDRT